MTLKARLCDAQIGRFLPISGALNSGCFKPDERFSGVILIDAHYTKFTYEHFSVGVELEVAAGDLKSGEEYELNYFKV